MSGPFGAAPPAGGTGPATAGPPTSARAASAAGYWIGGGIIVVGAVVAVIWFVSGISSLFSAVDSYPRFTVPGQITTPLEAQRYKVFAEYPGATTDINGVFRVGDLTVTDSTGRPVQVSSAYSEETYSWNGHEGRSIAEFTAPTAGNYTIEATLPPTRSTASVRLAVGRGLQPSALVPLFAAAGLGGLAVLAGIVLIVVTAVRRGRAKRRINPAPVHAYAYPGAHPGPYGQWGAPPTPWGAPVQPGPPGRPGPPAQPPAWGVPVGPPTGAPMPPPAGGSPYPPPTAQPPTYQPPTYPPPVSPPAQAPQTPPVVPPGWGAAPGAPGHDAVEAPGAPDPPDPDRP